MSIATVQEMKEEAIRRMKQMGVWEGAVQEFEQKARIFCSERPAGAFFDLDEEQQKILQEVQNDYGGLVYMVVRANTTIGLMDSFLWVSKHKEEWDLDREDIQNGLAFSWTHNYAEPMYSEFGSIIWKMGLAGGPIRVG